MNMKIVALALAALAVNAQAAVSADEAKQPGTALTPESPAASGLR